MSLPTLKPTLLTDQVYAVLHEAIISGEMPAGSRLRVRDLAEQVGTSVMPVREAIRRLEEAGLAEREPHKGAVVKGLTLAELVHVYDVRRLLGLVVDRDSVFEIGHGHGRPLVTGLARLDGYPVGVLASDPLAGGGPARGS